MMMSLPSLKVAVFFIFLCYNMVSFRGQKTPGPRKDWSPLRVLCKISDEHPSPVYMGVLPPGGGEVQYSTPVLRKYLFVTTFNL